VPAAVDSPVFITDDGLDATSPTWRQVAAGDAWHAGPFVATGEMVRIAGVEVSVRLAPRHGTRSPTLVIQKNAQKSQKVGIFSTSYNGGWLGLTVRTLICTPRTRQSQSLICTPRTRQSQ